MSKHLGYMFLIPAVLLGFISCEPIEIHNSIDIPITIDTSRTTPPKANGLTYEYNLYVTPDLLSLVTPVALYKDSTGEDKEIELKREMFSDKINGRDSMFTFLEVRMENGMPVMDENKHVIMDTIATAQMLCWQCKLFYEDADSTRMPKHEMKIGYRVTDVARAIKQTDDILYKCGLKFSGLCSGVFNDAIYFETHFTLDMSDNAFPYKIILDNYADLQDYLNRVETHEDGYVLGPDGN